MLRIGRVRPGGEQYYFATVAATTDRPAGLVEADPVWLGEGAALLGLSGSPGREDVNAILRGASPQDGEMLVGRAGRRVEIAAFDVVLSAPKSVSIVHALASEELSSRVREAHEAAVAATIGYLEREALSVRRRSGDREWEVGAEGAIAVGFLHRTSRRDDPHLHTHALIANLACGPDGSYSALYTRRLFARLAPARALFETHLRAELTRAGVRFAELRGVYADIAGIERATVAEFSRRTREINRSMAALGLSRPEEERAVAAMTRPVKDRERSYEELQEMWRERGYAMGLSQSRIDRAAGLGHGTALASRAGRGLEGRSGEGRSGEVSGGRSGSDFSWVEHVRYGLDGTFAKHDLAIARCATAPEGATVDEVERDVGEAIRRGAVVASGSRFTTERIEEELSAVASHLRELACRAGGVRALSYPDGGRLEAIDRAGRLAAEAAERGASIIALAPGRRAAMGIEAMTGIESYPVREAARLERRLGPGDAVWITDAGVLTERELSSALEVCERTGAEPVLFGQRGSIERSRLLDEVRALAEPVSLPAFGREAEGRPVEGRPVEQARSWLFGPNAQAVLVADPARAREEALTVAAAAVPTGRTPDIARATLLVVPDRSFLAGASEAARSARPERAGIGGLEVVAPRAVRGRIEASLGDGALPPVLVVMGGAGSLELPRELLGAVERTHVLVSAEPLRSTGAAPGEGRGSDCGLVAEVLGDKALGRAAEAVQPGHLTRELGAVPSDPGAREAWREGATMIERFRERHSLTAEPVAFGGRTRSPELAAADELAARAARAELARLGFPGGRQLAQERAYSLGR